MELNFLKAKDAWIKTKKIKEKKIENTINTSLKEIETYINKAINSGKDYVYVPYELVNDEVREYLENELGYYVADEPRHRIDCDWDFFTGFDSWEWYEIFISWSNA